MGVVYLPSEDSLYRFLLLSTHVSELKIDCRIFSSKKFSRRDFLVADLIKNPSFIFRKKGLFYLVSKKDYFIQNFCIFDAVTRILRSFQFDLWTIDHKKPLEPQGIGVVLLLRDFFQKKKHFSERYLFLDIFYY